MKRLQLLLSGVMLLALLAGCVPLENSAALTVEKPTIDDSGLSAEVIGSVDFPISCSDEAQAAFDQGLALLHSFFFGPSMRKFTEAAELDSTCAMPYWGQAMIYLNIPWSPTSEERIAAGLEAVEQALALGAPTERELAYIDAAALLYVDSENRDFQTRIKDYELAMEQLVADFPDDLEAKTFYGLALNMTWPRSDLTFANLHKAAEVLLPVYEALPNHPGAAHYLIHSYDVPSLAASGLEPALDYAKIAPAAPHAQHMPSHIFSRLGAWQDSIDSNSVAAASANASVDYDPTVKGVRQTLHALDYMVYAHLQLGQDDSAKALMDEVNAFQSAEDNFAAAYALAAISVRRGLERADWGELTAVSLPPADFPWDKYPQAEVIVPFARGLGNARAGDVDAAREELAQMESLHAQMVENGVSYWPGQAEIQMEAIAAWVALAEGNADEALATMQNAVAMESKSSKHPVTPGWLIPMNELLGDMLLELEEPADALAAYEAALVNDPNRLRGIFGAGHAAEMAGDMETAKSYFTSLIDLTATAEVQLSEMDLASATLGQ